MTPAPTSRLRVWDLPTRIFHWSLFACVVGAFITIKAGGDWIDWHMRFGLTACGLLLFRLIWGFVGSRYARFCQFLRGPAAVVGYVRGRVPAGVGHSPLAGWAAIALLALFGFQAFSGLFTTDDILVSGPLAGLSGAWSDTLSRLHRQTEPFMLGLVALHVLAIVWYRFRGQRLTSAMIHGDARLPADLPSAPPAARDDAGLRLRALALAAAITALMVWVSGLET